MSLLVRHRFALAICLVAVGLGYVLAFNAVGAGFDSTVSADAFDPETEPDELDVSPRVYVAERGSPLADDALEATRTAAAEGRYEGTVSNADRQFFARDGYDFAVFGETVYAFDATVDGEAVVLTFDERAPASVADELAVPFDRASDVAREAIETGASVEADDGLPTEPIVEHDGTYYVVTPDVGSETAVLLLLSPISLLLGPAGVAFVVAGAWLLRRFSAGEVRPMTPRRAAILSGATVPGMLLVLSLLRSNTSPMWLFVSVALAVASGLLLAVGVSLARGSHRRLAGAVLGGPALLVVAAVAAGLVGGVAEAVFALGLGVVGLVGVGFAASPLVLVGYRFARPLEATTAGQ